MAESSYPWDGVATGDASVAPYDAATEWGLIQELLIGSILQAERGGVVDDGSNLGITIAAPNVNVIAGYGAVCGTLYRNSATIVTAIATPAGSTRNDRFVLRKDWAAQTVRLTQIVGVEGGGTPGIGVGTPAFTQTYGVIWDTPLYVISTTTAGAISFVNDDRIFLPRPGRPQMATIYLTAAAQVLPGAATVVLFDFAYQYTSVSMRVAATPERIIIPTTGWYRITAYLGFVNNAASVQYITAYIRKNGAVNSLWQGRGSIPNDISSQTTICIQTPPVSLVAGDYITVAVANTASLNLLGVGVGSDIISHLTVERVY